MANVVIKLNSAGVRDLLRSAEVRADLERRGGAVVQAAGDGYEVESKTGSNRARVTVRTATFEARRAEAVEHRLVRSLDAGRG